MVPSNLGIFNLRTVKLYRDTLLSLVGLNSAEKRYEHGLGKLIQLVDLRSRAA